MLPKQGDYAQPMPSSFLVIIGDARGLAWILREHRMAFPTTSRGGGELAQGDKLFLLTTRACFGNPTKDRTRIVGKASVASAVVRFDPSLKLADRTFDRGFDLMIEQVVPFRTGVELQPLVSNLDAFPNKRAWSGWLRRPLLRLSEKDALLLNRHLQSLRGVPDESIPDYLEWIEGHPNGHPKPNQ